MIDTHGQYRFYTELARWWPLISPPDEYVEEAAYVAGLLRTASEPVRTVLELGSGGGSNAVHLKDEFVLTLVDLSSDMLEVSSRLNPECEHLQGDMRTLRLDRQFDAVFLHDAIDYMTTAEDLSLAVGTAFAHCRPGGLAVFVPDHVREIFAEDSEVGGIDGADGRAVRFVDWSFDPDPDDTWVQTEYAFLLRDTDGTVTPVHETHRTGLFPTSTWLRILREQGFQARAVEEQTAEDRTPRVVFLGARPG